MYFVRGFWVLYQNRIQFIFIYFAYLYLILDGIFFYKYTAIEWISENAIALASAFTQHVKPHSMWIGIERAHIHNICSSFDLCKLYYCHIYCVRIQAYARVWINYSNEGMMRWATKLTRRVVNKRQVESKNVYLLLCSLCYANYSHISVDNFPLSLSHSHSYSLSLCCSVCVYIEGKFVRLWPFFVLFLSLSLI